MVENNLITSTENTPPGELRRSRWENQEKKRSTLETAFLSIFAAQIAVFAILAWIVPFGHITMEFFINAFVVVFLRLKRKLGSMVLLGAIVGVIDMMTGLGGPGAFLAPVVYGFRFGFLEFSVYYIKKIDMKKRMVVLNSVGYFLTSVLIWAMYFILGIPLGTEYVYRMWFIFAAVGSIIAIPATLLAIAISNRILGYLAE
jgi:hypothetical protein